MSESKTQPDKGEVAPGALLPVIHRIHIARQTGMLTVRRGEEHAAICLIGGEIAWGHTNIEECRLGESMVRSGRITFEARQRAGDVVGQTGRRIGQVLLEMGVLDQNGLEEALAGHVREILLTLFSWTEGTWSFEQRRPEDFPGFDKPLRISTAEVILDAVWSLPDEGTVQHTLGSLDRVLRVAKDYAVRAKQISPTPEDAFIASRVDGTLTAREVLEIAPLPRAEAERRLLGLLCTGVLEYAPSAATPPAAPVPGPRTTVPPPIASAPPQPPTAASFPTQPPPVASAPPKPPPAPPTPPTPPPAAVAPPTPPAEPPVSDEETLLKAEGLFDAGKYWEALEAADDLIERAQGEVRTRVRILRARVYLKDPARSRDADRELRETVQEDPQSADAYYLLGMTARNAGATMRAQSLFRQAIEANPQHSAARKALAASEREAPGKEKDPPSLLKRILPRS